MISLPYLFFIPFPPKTSQRQRNRWEQVFLETVMKEEPSNPSPTSFPLLSDVIADQRPPASATSGDQSTHHTAGAPYYFDPCLWGGGEINLLGKICARPYRPRTGWPRQGESWCSKLNLLPISQKQAGSTTIDQFYMAPTEYNRETKTDRAHTTSKLNTAHHLEAPWISTCETLLHRKDVLFKGMKKYFGKTSTSLPGPG